ncbi:MAG TPA: hypothetical protein VNM14_12525 [Planctomycetota bacterium]|nr:hypothetical protein [Planctomycetota bacterium]
MRRIVWVSILWMLGCDPGPKPPAVLQETELKERIHVEVAEPLDPAAVLFTIHKSGLITWKGAVQSKEEMVQRTGSSEIINRTPILFDVEADAPFTVVRDALSVLLVKLHCVNCSFLVDTKTGPGAVVFPMPGEKGNGWHVYEGRDKEGHVGKGFEDRCLEVVVHPGKGGEINVAEVNYDVAGIVVYERQGRGPEIEVPRKAWTGEHPPCGIWTRDMLRTFLSREDVFDGVPYIHFKLSNREPVSDVIRCMAALRTIKGITIIPLIPAKE